MHPRARGIGFPRPVGRPLAGATMEAQEYGLVEPFDTDDGSLDGIDPGSASRWGRVADVAGTAEVREAVHRPLSRQQRRSPNETGDSVLADELTNAR